MRKIQIVKRIGAGYYCKVKSGTGTKLVRFDTTKHRDANGHNTASVQARRGLFKELSDV